MEKYITFQHVFDKVDNDRKLLRKKLTVNYKLLPHDKVLFIFNNKAKLKDEILS
jgi:hypothetical protein